MSSSLMNMDRYIVFTFATTSQALKAERVMQEAGARFMVMPTLREISASCGLSLKIPPENFAEYRQHLLDKKVIIDAVYQVKQEGGERQLEKLTI